MVAVGSGRHMAANTSRDTERPHQRHLQETSVKFLSLEAKAGLCISH